MIARLSASGVLASLAACNFVFQLDETKPLGPPPPDRDDDGVADTDDLCPANPDPDQTDGDGDGFGDACDTCPGLATPNNHDEDGDLLGDACDACPGASSFPSDLDGDGIGDACDHDNSLFSTLVVFDPFLTLGQAWSSSGIQWEPRGDAIAPIARLDASDPGLRNPAVVITHTSWRIDVGAFATSRPGPLDTFGVWVYNAGGARVAGCTFVCGASCSLQPFVMGGMGPTIVGFEPHPQMSMTISVPSERVGGPGTDVFCSVRAGPNVYANSASLIGTILDTSGAVALIGSPTIELAYVSVVD